MFLSSFYLIHEVQRKRPEVSDGAGSKTSAPVASQVEKLKPREIYLVEKREEQLK